MREMILGEKRINDSSPCYVIAEIGHNHQGSIELCRQLFDAAKECGCDAVKLQKRHNKTLYTSEFYNSVYNSENSFGKTYGEHREALEFDIEQYQYLKAYAESLGLMFCATAFDIPSLLFLARLGVPAIKIASGDLTNTNLLREAAKIGKPVILSTGGGTMDDVWSAHEILGGIAHAILQCTSGYPANYENLNLNVIKTFRDEFPNTVIGWSGHDKGIGVAAAAYAMGARIIEKHFTLDRSWKGTDQSMSLEPQGMKKMVKYLQQSYLAMGSADKIQLVAEIEPLKKQRKNAEGKIDGLQTT